jgi:hypothetical protein
MREGIVKKIIINDKNFQNDFLIDPTEATLIEDCDERKLIEIPK